MTTFNYVAIDSHGLKTKGEIQAESLSEAKGILKGRSLRVETVKAQNSLLSMELTKAVGLKDLNMFATQLSTYLDASVPLVESIGEIAERTDNKKASSLFTEIMIDIRDSGITFADALAKHPKVFNAFFVKMVAAGEESGNLDDVLKNIVDQQNRTLALRSKIRSAMIYPIFVLVLALGMSFGLLTTIVPQFANILLELGGELPVLTKIVIGMSEFVKTKSWVFIVVIIAMGLILRLIRSNEAASYKLDQLILKIPAFGSLLLKSSMANISTTLYFGLKGDLALRDSLELAINVIANKVIKNAMVDVYLKITNGQSMYTSLDENKEIIPGFFISLVKTGENTGDIQKMFGQIASHYQFEVDEAAENIPKLVEPVLIVFIGAVVGFLVGALFAPLFAAIQAV